MFNITKEVIDWCGKELTIETGKLARQADGAVFVTYGETSVLCTVVAAKEPAENINFLPLTVHYREMNFAAGKIPGGFSKREGKPTEKEVLSSRLIDRPIRPLFPEGFFNEVQIICSVLSFDGVNDPDVLAIIGASAALMIAGIPFEGPIAAIRIGRIDNNFICNPSMQDYPSSDIDLVIAGTKDSILMVEAGAKEVSEEKMLEAIELGHKSFQPVIKMLENLQKKAGKEKLPFIASKACEKLAKQVASIAEKLLTKAYQEKTKKIRNSKIDEAKKLLLEKVDLEEYSESEVMTLFKKLQEKIVRAKIGKNDRIDGRSTEEIRDICTEVSMLNRAHGSALFTRGETQAIVATTLGSAQDGQIIDSLSMDGKEHFMLHYNFPPFSVGELSVLRAPGRREIGHGKLAWKAIYPVLPDRSIFPYVIRTVSEITESNGSSSMATVCGTSLSLMDAGVPIKKPVAGIAMGLVKENKKSIILSDISGDEDHLGDMDFKVAGTEDGITALQMDIKIAGITHAIMEKALAQARNGRLHILKEMSSSLSSAREDINKYAPSITSITIPKSKIGEIIGPSGKTIKAICEKTGAKIDINDEGILEVSAPDAESSSKALDIINGIVSEAQVGGIYQGIVTKILDFGAVVTFMGNKEGLLHISEISDKRIDKVSDVLKENQEVTIKVIGIDDRKKKLKLSMKRVNSDSEEEHVSKEKTSKPSSGKYNRSKGNFNKKSSEETEKNGNKEKVNKKYFNF